MQTLLRAWSRYWMVISAICIGIFLRLWAGFHQPIFSEEAFSIFESKKFPFPYDPSYPPLYPLFLTQWTKISDDLFWVRLPNIVAGSISIFIFWRMISVHLNKKIADLGAILIATSSLHIHYSWVARPHSFMMLFSLLSLSQLWNISSAIRRKQLISNRTIILYLCINSIGALVSHGFTMFLIGSLAALLMWTWKLGFLPHYWQKNRRGVYIMALHSILPFVQLGFIIGRLHPLIDSAAWIPDFSLKSIISVLLTLTNATKTLTGEMYTSALISMYVSFIVLLIIFRALYIVSKSKMPFIALLTVWVFVTSIISCAVVYLAFDMTILQPRQLLPIHILYLLCLACSLPSLARGLHRVKMFSSARWYERMFIVIFLIFGVRSLYLLNIHPYYNSPRVITAIKQLKTEDEAPILIFPRYEVITIRYLWGLTENYPSLRVTDELLSLSNETPTEDYLRRIPTNIPIRILLLIPVTGLSPGAQEIVKRMSPSCDIAHVDNIDILNCPPLTHEL